MKIIFIALTIIVLIAIIKMRKKQKISLKRFTYSQSDLHQLVKSNLPSNFELKDRMLSQSELYMQHKTVRVITTPDQKAYWVKDNKFYFFNLEDGDFDPSAGTEIDTETMSKEEMNKMLTILDVLNRGKNDRWNTRN